MDCRFGSAPLNDSATVGTGALASIAVVYALTALVTAVLDPATVGSGLIWGRRQPSSFPYCRREIIGGIQCPPKIDDAEDDEQQNGQHYGELDERRRAIGTSESP